MSERKWKSLRAAARPRVTSPRVKIAHEPRPPLPPRIGRWGNYYKTREQERESYNAKVMERGWGELR